MIISNYSDHKDEAFQVLMEYVSKENQTQIAREMGSGVVLTDQEVLDQFGADIPDYEGKNIEAFFALEPAEYDGQQSLWDRYVNYSDEGGALEKLAEGIDINTILRETAEDAETKILEAQAQQ